VTDVAIAFMATLTDGTELPVRVRSRSAGPTVHIGSGYSEYYVRDLCRHPLSSGETFCIHAGTGQTLDASSAERVYALARQASEVDDSTLDQIESRWREASEVKDSIYDPDASWSQSELENLWIRFHTLLDEIDALYDGAVTVGS
jgi:hypothetical protein